MDKLFSEFYKPDYETINSEAHIIFDTNILLSMYSYTDEVVNDLFALFEKHGERIWIPYHVALEFNSNRISSIASKINKVKKSINDIVKAHKEINNEKSYVKICASKNMLTEEAKKIAKFIDFKEKDLNDINESLDTLIKKLVNDKDDDLAKRINAFFEDRVGDEYDNERLGKLCETAEKRYEQKIPPGYKDVRKEEFFLIGEYRFCKAYSDYIIWEQIKDYAKNNNLKSIIFVSQDVKEDWVQLVNGNNSGPRPELRYEIRKQAGVEHFWTYTFSRFYEYFGNKNEKTIKELNKAPEVSIKTNIYDNEKFLSFLYKTLVNEQFSNNHLKIKDMIYMKNYITHEPTNKTMEVVQCPVCNNDVKLFIGIEPISTTWHTCNECSCRFAVHRKRDGSVFISPNSIILSD